MTDFPTGISISILIQRLIFNRLMFAYGLFSDSPRWTYSPDGDNCPMLQTQP